MRREHLKRVHSPVQCERCHEIFPGTDRAACLSRLAEHRKMDVSCELGDPSRKEGIDEAQWAALDKQNRKKNQETHRVEKWFEIWDVLFPGRERPKSPCEYTSRCGAREGADRPPKGTTLSNQSYQCLRRPLPKTQSPFPTCSSTSWTTKSHKAMSIFKIQAGGGMGSRAWPKWPTRHT
jgi:hypothetical protein